MKYIYEIYIWNSINAKNKKKVTSLSKIEDQLDGNQAKMMIQPSDHGNNLVMSTENEAKKADWSNDHDDLSCQNWRFNLSGQLPGKSQYF